MCSLRCCSRIMSVLPEKSHYFSTWGVCSRPRTPARTAMLRVLDLKSGGLWFKSSTLLLSTCRFVLGSPEFNSSVALCKQPTGQPPTSWGSNYLCSVCNIYLFMYSVLNQYNSAKYIRHLNKVIIMCIDLICNVLPLASQLRR